MKAKKSYGQHFLTNEALSERIAESLQLTHQYKKILEVGPGKGMLTKYLLQQNNELVVVEADRDMVHYLKKHYPSLIGQIIEEDFLKVQLDLFFKNEPFGLIGNFPYNISSQILFKMLDYKAQIPEMVGMFQKEVADRIIAPPGSKTYGVISVLIQIYYKGELLFDVDKGNFNPPPKVQSAVIRLTRRDDFVLDCDEKLFKRVVKQAFSQRRKMLRNTMKLFSKDPDFLSQPLLTKRPEHLSIEDFVNLTKEVALEMGKQ